MERLTNSDKEIPTLVDNAEYWLKVYFKLKNYEGLEEQGRLVKLPCKVGDNVWVIMTGMTGKHPVLFRQSFELSMLKHWGTSVFLTKSEAEAKLKELRGAENGN